MASGVRSSAGRAGSQFSRQRHQISPSPKSPAERNSGSGHAERHIYTITRASCLDLPHRCINSAPRSSSTLAQNRCMRLTLRSLTRSSVFFGTRTTQHCQLRILSSAASFTPEGAVKHTKIEGVEVPAMAIGMSPSSDPSIPPQDSCQERGLGETLGLGSTRMRTWARSKRLGRLVTTPASLFTILRECRLTRRWRQGALAAVSEEVERADAIGKSMAKARARASSGR